MSNPDYKSRLDRASKQIVRLQWYSIIHPETTEQENALKAFAKALKWKFEVAKENPYNPKFVAEIEESREQYKKGEFISIDKKDIKSFLGLK